MTTEISEQVVILALNTDLGFMEVKNNVSNVPFSFSPTKAQEAEATAQTTGTIKNKSGHSSVVKASSQNWR